MTKTLIILFLLITTIFTNIPFVKADTFDPKTLLETELKKLTDIRNDASNKNVELEKLKEQINTESNYIKKLSEILGTLEIKARHIESAIEISKDNQAKIEILFTNLENELEQVKQILKKIFIENKKIPEIIIKKINNIVSKKLKLKQELTKHRQFQLENKNKIIELKIDTQNDITIVKSSIAKYKESEKENIEKISLLEAKIKTMQKEEENIRNIVLAISNIDQSKIEREIDTIDQTSSETQEETIPKDFIWPVEPLQGISAGFMDSDYENIFGIPHKAIDIPTPQGTPVKAIADGVVIDVKQVTDDGYQYVILGHKDEIQSVYGHLNIINVKKGDLIRQGEIIGKSGGIPGTQGAGPISTGAHLHLEIIKNKQHINPLDILE